MKLVFLEARNQLCVATECNDPICSQDSSTSIYTDENFDPFQTFLAFRYAHNLLGIVSLNVSRCFDVAN